MRIMLVLLLLSLSMPTWPQTEQISQQSLLINQMSSHPHQLIDVRSPEEYIAGHIKGAINIPFDEIAQHKKTFNTLKNKTLVVYCRSGRRAGIFEQTLINEGFNLLHLAGDMNAWQANELPTVKNN